VSAQTEDGIAHNRAFDDRAFAEDAAFDRGVIQLRARQRPRVREDGHSGVVKIKLRQRRRQIQIRLVKSANRSDVFPVILKKMRLHV